MSVLSEETEAPVIVLSGEDEGRVAWEGAVARMDDPPEIVAVVDLGGGSGELAVGTPIARQLATDLEVGRGGLREGAALALARAAAAAA